MLKRNIYTAIGMVLSLGLAFGGWNVTKALLVRKENALFSSTGAIKINMPAAEQGDIDNRPDEEAEEPIREKLTEDEMIKVLRNWESGESEWPHEPMGEQINMEQAIDAGEMWLSAFSELGVIPEELRTYEYDKISAVLCEKQPGDERTQVLELFYSYWTVSFSNKKMKAELTINAVTGQIWKAVIYSYLPDINFDNVITAQTLDGFTAYLELTKAEAFEADGKMAYKSLAGGKLYAVVKKSGVKINNETPYALVDIFLTTEPSRNN